MLSHHIQTPGGKSWSPFQYLSIHVSQSCTSLGNRTNHKPSLVDRMYSLLLAICAYYSSVDCLLFIFIKWIIPAIENISWKPSDKKKSNHWIFPFPFQAVPACPGWARSSFVQDLPGQTALNLAMVVVFVALHFYSLLVSQNWWYPKNNQHVLVFIAIILSR